MIGRRADRMLGTLARVGVSGWFAGARLGWWVIGRRRPDRAAGRTGLAGAGGFCAAGWEMVGDRRVAGERAGRRGRAGLVGVPGRACSQWGWWGDGRGGW